MGTAKSALRGDSRIERAEAVATKRWVPGEVGIWALILTDLAIFSIYFVVFMWQWGNDPTTFAAGHAAVSLSSGVLNTFFLLTASFLVALGVKRIRQGQVVVTQRLFIGAGFAGLAFIVNKYIEWSGKVDAGHSPVTDKFFQMYFVMTGIHLLHVLIAMTILGFMWRRASRVKSAPTNRQARFIENGASYWHMVDLLWLVIFALIYLMGGAVS
jgi:nitric oxide reductase NorE protein